jgi:hypothetical protein
MSFSTLETVKVSCCKCGVKTEANYVASMLGPKLFVCLKCRQEERLGSFILDSEKIALDAAMKGLRENI